MNQSKDLQALSLPQLRSALEKAGTRLDRPLLLSFDCDDTIVDRARGPNFITPAVVQMFESLRNQPRIHLAINTGRDALSYLPIEKQIGAVDSCLFVAGRVLRRGCETSVLANARLSSELLARTWDLFKDQVVPYLDIKHEGGFYFIAPRHLGAEKYFGHDRPPDWFAQIDKPIYYLEEEPDPRAILMKTAVVRMEVPLLRKRHPTLVGMIDRKELESATDELCALFGPHPPDVMYLPAATSHLQDQSLRAIGSLRLLCDSKLANKGTALRHLAHLLEIPECNVMSFGDSSSPVASDSAVADYMPGAHVFIAANGDERALERADFIMPSVQNEGAVLAVSKLAQLWRSY